MLRVSVLQLDLAFVRTPQEFFDRMYEPIGRAVAPADAAANDTTLVVLPNLTGWQLLGIALPSVLGSHLARLDPVARACRFPSVAAMLTRVAPVMRDFFAHLFASLAQRLGIYLAPGTVVELDGGRLYNTAYLFAPDGTLVGTQRQTHRAPQEIAWGLAQGETLRVFDMGAARVGFVIGEDVAYPEVSRILALQGANLLIHPAAYARWNDEHILFDLWREVQSNQVFGAQACWIGQGQSAIYAPVSDDAPTGIVAQAARAETETFVGATLDFAMLQRAVDAYPIFDFFNYDLYARAFPTVYQTARA